jgi:L-amino acid N-acyltransferase YncA
MAGTTEGTRGEGLIQHPGVPIHLSPLLPKHWPRVRAIYVEGIATGDATLETEPPGWAKWDAGHLGHSRIAALSGDEVVGWGALSPVSGRCVHAGVAEVSVYVAAEARGRGVGRSLLEALVHSSEEVGLWTLQAGIFPENRPSLAIHEGAGFRVVGTRERIGRLEGEWRDVVLLERRSRVVGAD